MHQGIANTSIKPPSQRTRTSTTANFHGSRRNSAPLSGTKFLPLSNIRLPLLENVIRSKTVSKISTTRRSKTSKSKKKRPSSISKRRPRIKRKPSSVFTSPTRVSKRKAALSSLVFRTPTPAKINKETAYFPKDFKFATYNPAKLKLTASEQQQAISRKKGKALLPSKSHKVQKTEVFEDSSAPESSFNSVQNIFGTSINRISNPFQDRTNVGQKRTNQEKQVKKDQTCVKKVLEIDGNVLSLVIQEKRLPKHLGHEDFKGPYAIIDNRFHFEYKSGHFTNAYHFPYKSQVDSLIEKTKTIPKETVVSYIFHCERSIFRGPRAANYFAHRCAEENVTNVKIYLLAGGYKRFWNKFKSNQRTLEKCCTPVDYCGEKSSYYSLEQKESRHKVNQSWTPCAQKYVVDEDLYITIP